MKNNEIITELITEFEPEIKRVKNLPESKGNDLNLMWLESVIERLHGLITNNNNNDDGNIKSIIGKAISDEITVNTENITINTKLFAALIMCDVYYTREHKLTWRVNLEHSMVAVGRTVDFGTAEIKDIIIRAGEIADVYIEFQND